MEKKRKDLDNFLKENLSDFVLSKKKGDWELLNHLLIEQKRKKKNRKQLLFIFCFLIILTSVVFLLLPVEKPRNFSHKHKVAASTIPAKENNSFKNGTDNSTETIPSNKNKIDGGAVNDIHQIKLENKSTASEKKNSVIHSKMKDVVLYPGNEQNPRTEVSTPAKTEIALTIPHSNLHFSDSDKTIFQETKNAESFAPGDLQDTVSLNNLSQQTTNQSLIVSDSLNLKAVNSDSLAVITKNNLPTDSSISKELIAKTNFFYLNFYAGANIYTTSSEFTNQENIAPLTGLEVTHPLASGFIIGLTGLYSFQGGYHLGDTVTKESYFFDKNVWKKTIHIHQLHKLYFPLTFYYALAKKHSILSAIQLSYLLNTNGNSTEMHHSSAGDSETQKNNVKGYMDGIKSTTLNVSLGYQYRMSKRFDVSSRITRELTEGYTKGYFYGVNTKPAWSFQTFLIVKF
ncbi:MAG TPA: hypothetical protein VJY62_11735 [Bacteroidia bacterium]|nr:hypothetical protein [Bacteroidia bacterium]